MLESHVSLCGLSIMNTDKIWLFYLYTLELILYALNLLLTQHMLKTKIVKDDKSTSKTTDNFIFVIIIITLAYIVCIFFKLIS